MQAKEVMTGNVKMIPSSATVKLAAELMRQMDIGLLPVSENGRVVGTLTDRDIAMRAVAEGIDPSATPTRDIMTREVISCYEEQDARDVARVMEENHVRRVVVVNRSNEAVGVISVDDLAAHPETRLLADEIVQQFSKHH